MEYIEGPYIITYRVMYKGRYLDPQSLTVQCRVTYDEAFRYVQNYWGYGYDDRLEILAIEPTEYAIQEHRMKLERERELEEREREVEERRWSEPEVHRYRITLGEEYKSSSAAQHSTNTSKEEHPTKQGWWGGDKKKTSKKGWW